MGFQEKEPDLLALLQAHAGGYSPTVVVPLRPVTSVVTRTPPAEAEDRKRKRGPGGKSSAKTEEGEIADPPNKDTRTGKEHSKKPAHTMTSKESSGDLSRKTSIWRPTFTLSSGNPVLDDANLRDPKKGSSNLVAECLEKALCLPEDMAELRSFRKRELFLSLKQDLGKVIFQDFVLMQAHFFKYNTHFIVIFVNCILGKPSKPLLWPRNG